MGKKENLFPGEIRYPAILTINPKTLTNKGQLFTTQYNINEVKLTNVLNGDVNEEYPIPRGYWWEEKKAIVLGDGNHKTAIAYMNGELIEVKIIGSFVRSKKPVPFNVFIRNCVSGMGLEY
jgi:hypothetical protein